MYLADLPVKEHLKALSFRFVNLGREGKPISTLVTKGVMVNKITLVGIRGSVQVSPVDLVEGGVDSIIVGW